MKPERRHHNQEASRRIKAGHHLAPLRQAAKKLKVRLMVGKPPKKKPLKGGM